MMNTDGYKIFVFVADGDVFHTLLIPEDVGPGIIEGLQSRPLVVDVTDRPEIFKLGGWKYDYESQKFYHPMSEIEDIEELAEQEDYEVE